MTSCSIFVPAYQAQNFLSELMERIPEDLWPQVKKVHIIDDGSQDQTYAEAVRLQRKFHKIQVHQFPENRGYGAVVKWGISKCREDVAEYIVCLHSDGQYPPEEILTMMTRLHESQAILIQGSRHAKNTALEGGMPIYKWFAGKVLVGLENWVLKQKQSDYHSGFLIYKKDLFEAIALEKLSPSFDIDLEIIVSAVAAGFSLEEHPILTRYADETSYLNPISYGFRVLKVLWNYQRGLYSNKESL